MSWWQRFVQWLSDLFGTHPAPDPAPPLPTPDPTPAPIEPAPPVVLPPQPTGDGGVTPPVVVGPPPVVPPAPRSPAEILGIAGGGWKLQYGLPGQAGIKELSPADLAAGKDVSPYFATTPDGQWVRFKTMVNAGVTDNSTYPRVELREETATGGDAKWDLGKETRWYEVELMPVHLPPGKPQTCVMQFHDASDDLCEIIYQLNSKGDGQFTRRLGGSSSGQPVIAHTLNRPCVLACAVSKGQITVYRDGTVILPAAKMPTSSATYTKIGNYLQSNTSHDPASEYGEVWMRNVRQGVGAYLPPVVTPPTPDPVPTPVPPATQPTTIMIVRHGEKDDDHDGKDDVAHQLSVRGQQRARAIVPLFTMPRADLAVPQYIFASQGGRMVQTAQPTADALNLSIDSTLNTETAISQTAALLVKQAKAGKVVWAVVEHGGIPALNAAVAKLLGCTDKIPTSHADDDFSTGYKFVGNRFSTFQESVLPGDPGFIAT